MLRKMILTAGLTAAAFTTSAFAQFPKLNGPSLPTPKWNLPSLPAPNIHLPKPVVPTPKTPTSVPSIPKPNVPVISERIPSVPKVNLPDVPHIQTPKIPPSVTKIPTPKIPTPQIPKPSVPNISLPSAKDLGIRMPDKNRETQTVFTDPIGPSGRPSGKPGGKGEALGQSVPGVPIKRSESGTPATGQTKVVPPPEKPGGKPGVNVNVVFLPSGLLSGLSGGQPPGGWLGRPERPGRLGRLADSEQVVVHGGPEAVYPPAIIGPNSPTPVVTDPAVTTPVTGNTSSTPQVVVVNQAWVQTGSAGNGAVTRTGGEAATGETTEVEATGNTTALRLTDVFADGPAARAGLRADDLILKANGKRVRNHDDLGAAKSAAVDGKLSLMVFSPSTGAVVVRKVVMVNGKVGIESASSPINLDPEADRDDAPAGLADSKGGDGQGQQQNTDPNVVTAAQVSDVTVRGPAARSGLQPGDVILTVNGRRVDGPEALAAVIKTAGEEVSLLAVNPEDGSSKVHKLRATNGDIGLTAKAVAVAAK